MSKGKAPPAPDYTGAAIAQGQASKENVNMQNYANRPTVNTPWGQESWTTEAVTDPATGQQVTQWTQNTTLTPELQAALDSQIGLQQQRSNLAEGFMGRVGEAYSQPFDWQNLPQMAQAGPAQLAAGIADYSPGLSTNVSQQGVVGGFDFQGPQMGVNDFVGNIQQGVNGTSLQGSVNPLVSGVQFGVQQTPVDTNFSSMTGDLTRGVQSPQLDAQFNPMVDALRRTTGMENVQRSLGTGDNPALPAFDASYRDSIATDLVGRMMPVHQMQQQALETQLANQGFQKGTEAYKRAFDDLAGRQASERYNALDIAGNEAQRLYNMQMGQRQQAFNEDVGAGNFANSAANQAFQMGLAGNQFANQATQQAFNQAMSAQQAGNQALGQQFGQNLQSAQFGNQATNQAFQQALGATQAANQARGQQFNQNVTAGQFGNQAVGQAFNQLLGAGQFFNDAATRQFQQNLSQGQFANQAVNQAFNQQLGAGQFANDAAQQLYGMQMGQADLANRASQQAFGQDLAAQNLRNQALAQASQMDIARQQANNAAMQQQFQMEMAAAEQQNRLRQQAIAEQQLQRSMPLNEMNALLTGQQVGMPQMPGFQAAGVAQTPDLLGAANMQYQAALDAQNAKNAALGNTMGGLFSLGSAALGGGLFGF